MVVLARAGGAGLPHPVKQFTPPTCIFALHFHMNILRCTAAKMGPRRSDRLAVPVVPTPAIKTSKPNGITKPSKATPSQDDPVVLFASETLFAAHLTANATPLWLQIAKKSSPVPSITYASAIEVALCHGWIDGQRRSHSDTHFLQRFTPRRRGSLWSQRNVEIVERLIAEEKMTDAGMKEVDAAKGDGRWERAYARARDMTAPKELEDLLDADESAKRTYDALPKSDKFAVCWRVATLKTEAGRMKKAKGFVELLKAGKSPVS